MSEGEKAQWARGSGILILASVAASSADSVSQSWNRGLWSERRRDARDRSVPAASDLCAAFGMLPRPRTLTGAV